MKNPREFYDLLIDHARSDAKVSGVCLGQVWTYCKSEQDEDSHFGLAMSPPQTSRTLSFPGTLVHCH